MGRYYCDKCGAPLKKKDFGFDDIYNDDERVCSNCGALYLVEDGCANYCGDPDDLKDELD